MKIDTKEIRERADHYKKMAERFVSIEEMSRLEEHHKKESAIMALRYKKLSDWLYGYANLLEQKEMAADDRY